MDIDSNSTSKCLSYVQSFPGDSLLLTTESPGFLGTLLIDLTMKPLSGFEPPNPRLVIGKQLFQYSFN